MGEKVVANSDGLRALKVRVTRHNPPGVAVGLAAEGLDDRRDLGRQLAGGGSAVETEVQRHLVVARPARVQRGACRRDFGEAALDGGVNVLVGVEEGEGSGVELLAGTAQPAFDGRQLPGGDDPGGSKASSVGEAAGNVKGIQLVIGVER